MKMVGCLFVGHAIGEHHLKTNFNCTGRGDVKDLLSHLFASCNNNADTPSLNEIMGYFIHIEMWSGVTLVLHRNPTVIKTMDLDMKVMTYFLSMTGRNYLRLFRADREKALMYTV
eukprot:15365916-Ditylum_brightwellii.AAC.1